MIAFVKRRFSLFENIRQIEFVFSMRTFNPFVFPNCPEKHAAVSPVIVFIEMGTVSPRG